MVNIASRDVCDCTTVCGVQKYTSKALICNSCRKRKKYGIEITKDGTGGCCVVIHSLFIILPDSKLRYMALSAPSSTIMLLLLYLICCGRRNCLLHSRSLITSLSSQSRSYFFVVDFTCCGRARLAKVAATDEMENKKDRSRFALPFFSARSITRHRGSGMRAVSHVYPSRSRPRNSFNTITSST